MRAIDLEDLAAFADVARARSFRRAAATRGVSASTLSKAVQDLEARLKVRLLNRTTRSVGLTEAGARLLERTAPALAEIDAAVDEVQVAGDAPAGTVRINAPEPAVDLVLGPMVGPFLKAHPRIRLEIVAESTLIDIVAAGFDAGVRWGEHLAADMIAVPLGSAQRFIVVGSPELLATYGRPERPEDLLRMPCIRQRFLSGVIPVWEFERHGEAIRLDPTGPLIATSMSVQRRAALEAAGFWATFEEWAEADLRSGQLVSVLDDWCPSFPGPYLYYPSRRHMAAALRAFIDFARTWRA
jgi:DNA-binding transcriptional LysR family regulator